MYNMGHLRPLIVVLLVCVLIHLMTASSQNSLETSNTAPDKTSPSTTPKNTSPTPNPSKTSPSTTPKNTSPTPNPSKTSPSTTPKNTSPITNPSKTSPSTTPKNTSPITNPNKTSPSTIPQNTSITNPSKTSPSNIPKNTSITNPSKTSPSTTPQNTSPTPNPNKTSPSTTPKNTSPTPNPSKTSPSTTPKNTSPTPHPNKTSPSTTPKNTSPTPSKTSPSTTPKNTSPTPNPSKTSPSTTPQNTSPTPNPNKTSPSTTPKNTSPITNPSKTSPSTTPKNTSPTPNPNKTSPSTTPKNTSPTPNPSKTSPSTTPKNTSSTSNPTKTSPSTTPKNTSPTPNPTKTSPSTTPKNTSPTSNPTKTSPSTTPKNTSPTPNPSKTSPSTTPKNTSPTPNPSKTSPSTTPQKTSPTPNPNKTSPSTTPKNTSPTSYPSKTSPSTTPKNTSPTPNPSKTSPSTTPKNTSPTPNPSKTSPSTTPKNTSPTSYPSKTSPSTTPKNASPTPNPTKTSPSTTPKNASPTPNPTKTSPSTTPKNTSSVTPTPTKPSGTTPSTSPVTGKVTIMEVYYNLPKSHDPNDLPEFIELYGDRNLTLQGYTIVLFAGEDMKAFLIVSLDGYSLRDSNGAFVMATYNASFGPDLVLTNKTLMGPSGEITMVALYKNDSSSFTSDSTPSRDGLVDYVVYSSGTSAMPSAIRDWSPGFRPVVKDSLYPYESVTRCYSDEPKNQRAFTLSRPTPGKKNACDLRDDYPIINEVGHLGLKQHTCFIEIQFSNNASQALNSFFLAVYSKSTTSGRPKQNVTFDLWNERIMESGYFVLSGTSNGSQALDCGKTFVDGTVVVVLYQVPTDLRHFNKKFSKDDTYQYIKDGVAFNISSEPLDTNLADIVLPKLQNYPRVSLHDRGPLFLSGNQSLSSCGRSGYKLTDPTPGGPNICPLIPSTAPPVTTPTAHHTVKPNHVYINEVTYSAKNSEEYIEFKGDTQGDFSRYYIILFNTCTGVKIGGVPLNHALDQNGFLRFNHTSIHTFSETLQRTGSLALGLYTYDVEYINITDGLLDAIVMDTSAIFTCPFLPSSLKYLTPNVKKPVVLSKSELDNGMTLSRCSGNLRNSTAFKVTKFLTSSTPGSENICDSPVPQPQPSTDKNSSKAVMITIAVVASCLLVFLILFSVLVMIMKRKRRGVLQFRLALMAENDDDELIMSEAGQEDLITFNTDEDATFDNKTY